MRRNFETTTCWQAFCEKGSNTLQWILDFISCHFVTHFPGSYKHNFKIYLVLVYACTAFRAAWRGLLCSDATSGVVITYRGMIVAEGSTAVHTEEPPIPENECCFKISPVVSYKYIVCVVSVFWSRRGNFYFQRCTGALGQSPQIVHEHRGMASPVDFNVTQREMEDKGPADGKEI